MRVSRLQLKHQIALIFLFSALLFAAMEFYFYFSFYHLTQDRAANYEKKIIGQTRQKVDSVLSDIRVSTNIIVNDKKVQEFTVVTDDFVRNFDIGAFVIDLLDYMRNFSPYVDAIVVNDRDGRKVNSLPAANSDVVFTNEYSRFIDTYKTVCRDTKKGVFSDLLTDKQSGNTYFFYVAPVIESIGGVNFSKVTGFGTVMLNMDKLQDVVKNTDLTPGASLYILNGSDQVVVSNGAGNQKTLPESILASIHASLDGRTTVQVGGREMIVQSVMLEQAAGWSIVSMIPVSELTTDMNAMKNISIIAGVGIVISMVIMGYFFLNNLTRPVMGLVDDMKKVSGRNLGFRVKVRSTNEVGVLANDINAMLDNMEEMTRNIFNTQTRLYESELSKRHAEFAALQSQINPHFLYNTLNCISSIGMAYGSVEIASITSSMSRIFRYSIQRDELVEIREEISCIQAYLNIILIRYENKFAMEVETDAQILGLKTPKMILQPIVENSVYHGLENMPEGGALKVSGHMEASGDVCFTVTDTGIGIGEEELGNIRTKLEMDYAERLRSSQASGSVGLFNINNRIKLLFGEQYGVSMDSLPGVGTTVHIRIPGITEK